MIDFFLIPFYAFKWVFSLAFWYYGILFITESELYEKASDKIMDKWNGYREK
jgi:hypothetical protein